MNLTRQPLFKDVHNFFRYRSGQLSNTYTIQHNRGEIICKRLLSSKVEKKTRTWARSRIAEEKREQELEVDNSDDSNLPEFNPVRH